MGGRSPGDLPCRYRIALSRPSGKPRAASWPKKAYADVVDERSVAFAIPLFFLLIAIEHLILRAQRKTGAYRFADSITNLSCGIGQQVLEPFFKGVALLPYAWLYAHARIHVMSPASPVAWVLLVLGIDLGYYAFHRASHRVGFLWAAHSVHHQSEEYNLSVALRQPWLQSVMAPFFYLPLAVLGFPPLMYLVGVTADTLYQFWIHTRAVGRMGPVEWVMNTPSHHRVHHGIDPRYIDKNYAGIFIVWDRLLGTYAREDRPPVYGTVEVVRTWNPLQANLAHWIALARRTARTRSLADKVKVWFAPPDWRPADLGGSVVVPPADPAAYPRYDVRAPRRIQLYVAAQVAVAAAAVMAYLWIESSAPPVFLVFAATLFLATVVAWGGLLEGRRWAWPLEVARLVAAAALVVWRV
jgi:alkylglycerol monooxygenase